MSHLAKARPLTPADLSQEQASVLPFSRPEWIIVTVTFTAFVFNEATGPAPIFAALALWIAYVALRPFVVANALLDSGVVVWLMPALCLISVLWSNDPAWTLRMSLQLVLTTSLAILCARIVSPRELIWSVLLATSLAVVGSLFIRNQHYDGLTGIVSLAGIFRNKNTLGAAGGVCCLAALAIALNGKQAGLIRWGALAMGLLGLALCVLARSIAVILAVVIGLGCLTSVASAQLINPRKRSSYMATIMIAGILGAVVMALLIYFASDYLLRLVNKDSTLTGRTVLWFWANRLSEDHPVLGVGYQGFWRIGYAPAEYLWDRMRIPTKFGFHFHSLYYEMLIELGYAGVAVASVLLIYVIVGSIKWAVRDPGPVSGFYFAFIVYILVTQAQAWDLYTVFQPWHFLFVTTFIYVRSPNRPKSARTQTNNITRSNMRQTPEWRHKPAMDRSAQ